VDGNISDLVEQLQRKRDRATRVRRRSLPNGNGHVRPLGSPAVEDQRLPWAVTRLLTAIDAPDFRRGRDGYRPHLGALEAVDNRTITRPWGRDHGVVEADITGCCDPRAQEGMIRRLAERLDARALLRVSKPWLTAGGLDTDGQVLPPATGTPPGGIVSPIVAQVYLHDAVDRWCETGVKPSWRGEACLRRYAADVVGALAHQADAERGYTALGQRLGTCGRELSAEQTRVMPCSRPPPAPKTSVELLGFECRWGKDRAGKAQVTRRTARQKLRSSLKRCTHWCREHRHLPLGVLCARLNATRRGDDHDDGGPGNAAGLKPFFSQALGILQTWLNRRRQRRRDTWAGYPERLAHVKIERPQIVGRPKTRRAASQG
jgi:retron-type reverse transcriptase